MFHLFWNALNENIVSSQFFFVCSKQLFIKLESTALLSIDFKVSHSFASLFKLNGVFDVDNGRVEWSCQISSDLRLNIEVNISLSLESFCNFLTTDVFFWEIVKIDQVLMLVSEWLMHFSYKYVFIFLKFFDIGCFVFVFILRNFEGVFLFFGF